MTRVIAAVERQQKVERLRIGVGFDVGSGDANRRRFADLRADAVRPVDANRIRVIADDPFGVFVRKIPLDD